MPWFTIARTDGSSVTVASANLELTFSDGRMFADNGTERHDFNLSELKFMVFSAKSTEVQSIADAHSPVSVFTPAGSAVGDYSSASEAIRSLGSGVYIMKCGGTLNIRAYDDAINSSGHMYIKGGDITVVATANDGLDSNGNMYISGGTIRAFGASQPECGIDANEEEGYSVIFTGGVLLAVGGGNSTPSKSESTQPYVTGSASLSSGQEVTLKNGSEVLATFTVPEGYNGSSQGGGGWPGPGGGMGGSSVLVSCPGLTSGSSYTLTAGSSSSTVSARLTGGGRPGPGGRP